MFTRKQPLTAVALVVAATSTSFAVQPSVASPTQPISLTAAPSDATSDFFQVNGIETAEQRDAVLRSGVFVESAEGTSATIQGNDEEIASLRDAGLSLEALPNPADIANQRAEAVKQARIANGEVTASDAKDFPSGDEQYHTYDEVNEELQAIAKKHPDIAEVFDIGKSVEGRTIYGLKISDNVSQDENEPESLQNCTIHAREHLTTEMCMYMVNELTSKYGSEDRINKIVDGQVVWIIPMLNPDGAMYDISGGKYRSWRKNRQPGKRYNGIDLNRNFDYEWACCGGSSGNERAETYRGESPESGVEVKRLADFVRSRRTNDGNRIASYIDWHSYSELILWPYGYTKDRSAKGLSPEEADVFEDLGREMAKSNGYKPTQASGLYVADGSSIDWFWGAEKIWAFGMEMYPKSSNPGFYPPGKDIDAQTSRNREMFLTFLEHTEELAAR